MQFVRITLKRNMYDMVHSVSGWTRGEHVKL